MAQRILVVDDEKPVQILIKDYLESRGYEVVCAADGEQGLRKLSETRPHAAIIDFLLPRKNGFALAEAIRQDAASQDMPIIMMSGVFKNPKTAVEAREKYAVVEFLAKPIDMEHLVDLLTEALEGVGGGIEFEDDGAAEVDDDDDDLDLDLPDEDEDQLSLDEPLSSAVYKPQDSVGASIDDADYMEIEPIAAAIFEGPSKKRQVPDRGISFEESSSVTPVGTPPPRKIQAIKMRPSEPVEPADPVFHGRPFPELPEAGDLEELPVALLISTARYDQLTGMLDTTNDGTHRRVYILDGRPIFMQSNAEGENVGALLLRRGRITNPDFKRCLVYMKDRKRTMQRALLELRLTTEAELATAYKLLAGQLLPAAIGMPAGTFKWRETDAFVNRVPEGRFEAVTVLFDGIKRHVHPPQILRFFNGREDVPLKQTEEFDKLLPFFRRSFSAHNIAAQVDGHATYREITKSRPRDTATVVPQLYALVTSGMTVLPQVTAENAMDVAVNAAAAEVAGLAEGGMRFDDDSMQLQFLDDAERDDVDSKSEIVFSDQEKRARAGIRAAHDKYMSLSFFEIFELPQGEDVDRQQAKDAYFALAKKWHTDAFSGLRLGGEKKRLEEVFQRITEAYDTLLDDDKCGEYRVFLDRKSKGLPTDVQEVMRAEQLLDEALQKVKRKEYQEAKDMINEAIEINPAEAIFYAHLAWVTYFMGRNSQAALTEAVNLLKKATDMQERLPLAYQYLGQICMHKGQLPDAKRWFEKCLHYDKRNIEAARGIRLVNQRKEREREKAQRGTGLLSRFLKK